MKKLLYAAVAVFVLASPVWAGSKTVTLTVSNMTCVTCPLTVKMALTKVEGVSKAAVDFDKKEAVVTFDDAKTNAAALVKATTDAGYPSAVNQTGKR
ncbi:MAG: mercuric transport protein periplasmic component [Betaproteobacteria bacterium RIFCSPLOWO2_12_FULL_63_13]|nr:MAG: mercuric transport protein periplasmic component [Betaproteobacteria bacterium RIFCSPLOWO2_12_FULL_63_13]